MSKKRLLQQFFNRPTLKVSRELLGKFIVRQVGGRRISAMITEVEAYQGPRDRAAHTFGGRRTPRTEAMYGHGGLVYVYFVYGMHWQFNISTAGAGKPQAVLVRGVVPVKEKKDGGWELKLDEASKTNGPAKLCKYLKIDRAVYGADLAKSPNIWLEDRQVRVPVLKVKRGPRVGINYAGPYWTARPWRFWLAAPLDFLKR